MVTFTFKLAKFQFYYDSLSLHSSKIVSVYIRPGRKKHFIFKCSFNSESWLAFDEKLTTGKCLPAKNLMFFMYHLL